MAPTRRVIPGYDGDWFLGVLAVRWHPVKTMLTSICKQDRRLHLLPLPALTNLTFQRFADSGSRRDVALTMKSMVRHDPALGQIAASAAVNGLLGDDRSSACTGHGGPTKSMSTQSDLVPAWKRKRGGTSVR